MMLIFRAKLYIVDRGLDTTMSFVNFEQLHGICSSFLHHVLFHIPDADSACGSASQQSRSFAAPIKAERLIGEPEELTKFSAIITRINVDTPRGQNRGDLLTMKVFAAL